jgi:hypothetical protein
MLQTQYVPEYVYILGLFMLMFAEPSNTACVALLARVCYGVLLFACSSYYVCVDVRLLQSAIPTFCTLLPLRDTRIYTSARHRVSFTNPKISVF